MTASGFGELVLDCLKRRLKELRVRYALVFGSRSQKKHGPHSDYDVALKLGRETSFTERGLIYGTLEECIPQGLRLDLVFLDDWNPVVAWESLTKGKLIYHCGRPCLSEYYHDKARAIDEVADLHPLIRRFEEEARHALARVDSKADTG